MVSNKRAPGLLAAVIIACLVAALGFGRQVSTLASAEETGTHTLGTAMDDGTVVTIEAQADVLPQGTTVEARLVDDQKVIDAVNGKLQDGGNSATSIKAIDVTLRDSNGNEVQPNGSVKVTFSKTGMQNDGVLVYHVTDAAGSANAIDATDVNDTTASAGAIDATGAADTAATDQGNDRGESTAPASPQSEGQQRESTEDPAPTGSTVGPTAEASLKVEEVKTIKADADEQVFEANHFSIYAIVDTGDVARLEVRFHKADSDDVTSILVKKTDDVDSVVYDPGAGTVPQGKSFRGWTTDANYTKDTAPQTIADVRSLATSALASETFKDGDTLDLYPIVLKSISVSYLDEHNVSLGSTTTYLDRNEDSLSYTVNMAYTPASSSQNFEGWDVSSGSTYIADYTPGACYPNGSPLTLTGDVVFSVNAPEGHWLVFDENGKDATYNAPQFVKSGEPTQEPGIAPKRAGYTFSGWYTDKDCTPGNEFHFGSSIEDNTTIYAKWDHSDTADYTVVVWKQNVAGNGYDFSKYVMLNGSVDSVIDTVVQRGSGNAAYATIDGNPETYAGFHLDHFDQGVRITPEGTAVLNVYYDRTEYTLSFQAPVDTYSPTFGAYGEQYGYVNGSYVPLTYGYYPYYPYYGYIWTYTEGGNTYRYTGQRYVRQKSIQTVKTITALYGQDISQNFPIVGNDGTSYDGYVWTPRNSQVFTTGDVHSLEIMPAENTTLRLRDYGAGHMNHLYYYTEVAPGETGDVTYRGKQYNQHLHLQIASRVTLNSTKSEDFHDIAGFTQLTSDPSFGSSDKVSLNVSNGYSIRFYYSRDTYNVQYMDGVYVDSNNIVLENISHTLLRVTDSMSYGDDLSSYNAGGSNYYQPTPAHAGYSFAGWYLDERCTRPYTFSTMPENGVTVYAKWVRNRYRVFLHPNAGTDNTLDWGSDVPMTSLITYGEKVSLPTGIREGYDFVGWYTDPGCTQVFSADTLLSDAVTIPYDKNVDMTDPMDKWGNGATTNEDVDSPWVMRKLDLYAKWRKTLTGANGIGVTYDSNGGENAPSDTMLYLDNSMAVAGAASTAPAGKLFMYWVIQTWDEGQGRYVDVTDVSGTKQTVFPGDTFTVLKDNARVTENDDNTPEHPSYTYTVQLRAEYGDKGSPSTVKTIFDANGGSFSEGTKIKGVTNLNDRITVPAAPTRTGYDFVGWGASADSTAFAVASDPKLASEKGYAADNLSGLAWDAGQDANVLYAVWEPRPVELIVQKEIEGKQADLTKKFDFVVSVTHDGKTYSANAQLSNGEAGKFAKLADSNGLTYDLHYGDEVTVKEAEAPGYTARWTIQDVTAGDGIICSYKLTESNVTVNNTSDNTITSKVTFTNTKNPIPVTGIAAATLGRASLPLALGVGGAIAIAGVIVTRRRNAGWGA